MVLRSSGAVLQHILSLACRPGLGCRHPSGAGGGMSLARSIFYHPMILNPSAAKTSSLGFSQCLLDYLGDWG